MGRIFGDTNMEVQTTIKDVDEVTKKIDFVVPAERLNEAYSKKIADLMKKVTVKGFRKGKTPKNIVEKLYANDAFMECAWDVIDSEVNSKIREGDYRLVASPEVSIGTCEKDKDLAFSATLSLFPEPKITGYDKFKVEVEPKKEITDEDVEKAVEEIRAHHADVEEVKDRDVVQDGDVVKLMVQVLKDGVEPSKPEPFTLLLGENKLAPGTDEQIKGMKIGETNEVKPVNPEKSDEAKDGNGVSYNVEVKSILKRVLPEINDEFVSTLFVDGVKTVDEWKKSLKETLETQALDVYNGSIHEQILEQLRERNKFKVPQAIVDFEIRQMVQHFYTGQGRDYKIGEKEIVQYRDILGETALKRVELGIIVDRIATEENISANDEDLESFCEKFAKARNIPLDAVKNLILNSPDTKANTLGELKRDKVLEFLVSRAVVTDKKATK